jgi:deoxyadenosine/deoxycytidine kinase
MVQTVAYSAIAADRADTDAVAAVYERLTARVGQPAAVIRLTCDPHVQLRRIAARGREPEAGITRDYLDRLDTAIDAELARVPTAVPRIAFDTTDTPPEALLDLPELADALATLTRATA